MGEKGRELRAVSLIGSRAVGPIVSEQREQKDWCFLMTVAYSSPEGKIRGWGRWEAAIQIQEGI